jgi:hypothetical protein
MQAPHLRHFRSPTGFYADLAGTGAPALPVKRAEKALRERQKPCDNFVEDPDDGASGLS